MSALSSTTSNPTDTPHLEKASGMGPLVPVVEDHDDTRFLLKFVMEMRGRRVLEARDGEEALCLAKSSPPDLVLMDTNLPRVDGLMATRALRKLAKLRAVPIIIVSGHAQPEFRSLALTAGANDFFVKPVNLKELEFAVSYQLQERTRKHDYLRAL